MSTAHRPTWSPAVGKEIKTGSRSTTQKDYSSRTKLKFRQPNHPGQTSASDVAKRDLRAELLRAEREAVNKKRKAQGLAPLAVPDEGQKLIGGAGVVEGESEMKRAEEVGEEEQARKRRKVLEEAMEADRDDEDSDDEEVTGAGKNGNGNGKGKGKAVDADGDVDIAGDAEGAENDDNDDSDSDSDSDDDDEDDTAALMAELAKIKQERAEEKARQQAESDATNRTTRESEIALGNPLLNLQAALGQTPSRASDAGSSVTGSFAVKRRWDDDLVFKNQAAGTEEGKPKEFVNDLLRSEFHRKFMSKFIK